MSIYEYDEEATRKAIRDTAYERGVEDGEAKGVKRGIETGKQEAILELLEDMGDVSESLKKKIFEQKNLEILKEWHKLVARAQSIEKFEHQISARELG